MTRKLAITALLILGCAGLLSAKINAKDQEYFDGKFQELADQAKLLKAQQDALAAQLKQLADTQKAQTDALNELAKSQSRFETTIEQLQHTFTQLEVTISTLANNNTQDTQVLKQEIEQLRALVQETAGGGGSLAPKRPVVGYITAVSADNTLTVSLGSGNGLKSGSQLGLYKANDQNTRVGTLEVTDVVDQGSAHAKIKILNTGVQPEDLDVVKPD
ncbi:MAG TPA: hypothetical protein VKM93_28235 [Terriglobia bacterium]|nr:hypothetical protein [Terriglobia bacterium]